MPEESETDARYSFATVGVVCLTILSCVAIAALHSVEVESIKAKTEIEHDQSRPRKIWEKEKTE